MSEDKIDKAIQYLKDDIVNLRKGKQSIDKLITEKITEVVKLQEIKNKY